MISELGLRYKSADAERLELKRLIPDAQSSRNQLVDTIKKLRELEDAHMIQSKYIHQLQKNTSKVQKYIETIEIQEKVIMKMQKVIESSAPKRARIFHGRNRSESESNNDKIIFDAEDDSTLLPESQNRVDELRKHIKQLTEKVR